MTELNVSPLKQTTLLGSINLFTGRKKRGTEEENLPFSCAPFTVSVTLAGAAIQLISISAAR